MDNGALRAGDMLILATCIALGILFLSSGINKLQDMRAFRTGLRAYQLLPAALVAPTALLLPLFEIALALALLTGFWLPLAGAASAGLFLLFSGAVVVNLHRGRRIACHCHGLAGSHLISWGLVSRNAVLLAPCGLLIWGSEAAIWPVGEPVALLCTGLLVGSVFVLLGLVHHTVDVMLAVRRVLAGR